MRYETIRHMCPGRERAPVFLSCCWGVLDSRPGLHVDECQFSLKARNPVAQSLQYRIICRCELAGAPRAGNVVAAAVSPLAKLEGAVTKRAFCREGNRGCTVGWDCGIIWHCKAFRVCGVAHHMRLVRNA